MEQDYSQADLHEYKISTRLKGSEAPTSSRRNSATSFPLAPTSHHFEVEREVASGSKARLQGKVEYAAAKDSL